MPPRAQRSPRWAREPASSSPRNFGYYWAGIQVVGYAVGFLTVVVIAVGAFGPADLRNVILNVALVPRIAATAILAYATYRHTRRERQERRVGYTTTYESYYRDYWQLDPRTGEVLRRPGELKARRRSE